MRHQGWFKIIFATGFLGHWHSTAFGQTTTRCERSNICVVSKLCLQFLFDFATLRLRKALLTMCLSFCLFSDIRKTHGNRFMERISDVVLFLEFWYIEL